MVFGILLMATLSYGYTWSLMINPMIEFRGATDQLMATIYSVNMVAVSIFTLVGGKLLDRFGSGKIIFSGILAMVIGQIFCSFWTSTLGFALCYVILMGWHGSVVYLAVYDNIMKLFPDKKGTAVAIAGMGIPGGAIFMSPMCQWLIDNFGFDTQFLIMGVIVGAVGFISLFFFFTPPEGYVPEGYAALEKQPVTEDRTVRESAQEGFVQKDWKMMIKDPSFYLLLILPLFGTIAGTIISFQMSWLAQDIVKVTAAQAAWMVSAVSMANTLGKLFWGSIADKLGRLNVNIIIYACMAIITLMLMFAKEGMAIYFMICCIGTIFLYGGTSAIMAPLTSDLFGSKNFGFNFSIVYQAVVAAGIIGPWVAAFARGSGNLAIVFGIGAATSAVALAASLILRAKKKDSIEFVRKAK